MGSVYDDRERRLQDHINAYQEHRREAKHLLDLQFREAEKRAREAINDGREVDLFIDPFEESAKLAEWDEPNAWIEADKTQEVRQ